MERLEFKKNGIDIKIGPFDPDKEMRIIMIGEDFDQAVYFTLKEVYTIVEYIQTQLLEIEKYKT